ncbi:RNA polymerase sigma factor [Planctomycetes bacterium K23_9]|uniref:RNA polymerase sigma factor n=2 Tax=Stieleria marina TaxID=1930275 RepID=A0A517NMY5_9BACT|nr:RNA polymerase sigma factor [Planctomycetes bacterium K23_9]
MSDKNAEHDWPHDDWFHQLADGDPETVQQFWEQYGGPLRRVAERQIADRLRTRVDADDIVQSACRTFFRRIGEGQFEIEDTESLWRLLLTITLNKARMQARFHTRDRRSIGREQAIPQSGAMQPKSSHSFLADVDFADFLEHVFTHLDQEQRQILTMTLDGKTQLEISETIGCSERTVRRMRTRIQDQLRDVLSAEMIPNG